MPNSPRTENDHLAHAPRSSAPRPTDASPAKLLIIRFSSFGDIVQASAVPRAFQAAHPGARVDWLVREDFATLLSSNPAINRVISFERRRGLCGLIQLAWTLASATEGYTHLYDAHSNMRSRVVSAVFRLRRWLPEKGRRSAHFLRRPKERWRRFLFFKLRLNTLPRPYRGAESFLRPLKSWQIALQVPRGPQFEIKAEIPVAIERELLALGHPVVALAPSAAWAMKRWPKDHWRRLISLLPQARFILLGGNEDTFIAEIASADPTRTLNLAGKLNLSESSAILKRADLVIANDTGLLHVADQMERPTLALIGPTAFGYPSHPTSRTLETKLKCQPCSKDGRGRCTNEVYQRCLVDLQPEAVAAAAQDLLSSPSGDREFRS